MLLGLLIKESMSSPNILTVCKLCYGKQKGSRSHWSRINGSNCFVKAKLATNFIYIYNLANLNF